MQTHALLWEWRRLSASVLSDVWDTQLNVELDQFSRRFKAGAPINAPLGESDQDHLPVGELPD